MNGWVKVSPFLVVLVLAGFSVCAQTVTERNESATAAAEGERRVMEATLREVLDLVGSDSERGKMFLAAQNEWVQYTKQQAEADADGVSGDARYPGSYFETLRELTRYRTRVLEGCLRRLQAEETGVRDAVAGVQGGEQGGAAKRQVRDWKAEVGDGPYAGGTELYVAQIEGVDGILAGQWRGEKLWRGVFFAERGDTMVLYGGKMERGGGIVFEAWQEGARIGRGFVRDEDGNLRGRFFDERRRESAIVLQAQKRPGPVGYDVTTTPYAGILGSEDIEVGLEWHNSRFVRGNFNGSLDLKGHNYDSGKIFLEEWETGPGGRLVALWRAEKTTRSGATRWVGARKGMNGEAVAIDFGRK
ncbi:MAG: hypothetical protein AAGC74_04335 [Verrucomicrobiota bacterium]